jgi:uncharacterized membrane protein (UPF0127 family)
MKERLIIRNSYLKKLKRIKKGKYFKFNSVNELKEHLKKRVIKFSFNGKKYSISDYKICDNFFSKARGLMFRNKKYKKPLLFVFDRAGKYSIHSFFCRKFIGVWMLKGKIIDVKMVLPWKYSVTLKVKFDELLEIPLNSDD